MPYISYLLLSFLLFLPDQLSAQNRLIVSTGHQGSIRVVKISPNKNLIASGSTDKTIKLWEVTTGRELSTFVGHKGYVWDIDFSPDQKKHNAMI